MRAEIVEGLRYLLAHRLLRMLTASVAVGNFAFSLTEALSIVFLVRGLHQSPGAIGLLFAAGGVGGVIGAMSVSPATRWVGASRVTLAGVALADLGLVLVPLAQAGPRLALFAAGQGLVSWGIVVFNVTMVSFRQRLVPNRLMGRVVASQRVIMWGSAPLGSLIGGVLGETIGVRGGLWVAAAAFLPSLAILLATPLRTGRDLPEPPPEPGPQE
jgi:predicted MFS family arabinose efflux permease